MSTLRPNSAKFITRSWDARSQFPPADSCWRYYFLPTHTQSVVQYDCTSATQMYVILFFLGLSLFQDLIFFQDSVMSSYIGFHCYKISSLFEDLASMNKTLSISVGLHSHACNGQDLVCSTYYTNHTLPKRVRSQHNNTHRHYLLPLAAMINWGDDQNNELILGIEKGDIDPHNFDGTYLFEKQFSFLQATKGTGLPKQGRTSSHDFAKSSETLYLIGL